MENRQQELNLDEVSKEQLVNIIDEQQEAIQSLKGQVGQLQEAEAEPEKATPVPPETKGDMLDSFMNALQNQDMQQAQMLLTRTLRDAGMDPSDNPERAREYLKEIKNTFDLLPDTPEMKGAKNAVMSQAVNDMGRGLTSNATQDPTMRIIDRIVPFVMVMRTFRDLGLTADQGGGGRSDLEQRVMDRTVDLMMGEQEEGGGKLDEIAGELRTLNRRFQSGEIGRDTAIEKLTEEAENLSSQMDAFGNVAKSMGYSPENQGTLEKLTDVSGQFKEIIGNLREAAPSRSEKPEKKIKKAESGEEAERTKVPIEGKPEPKEGESSSESRPRNEKGQFVSESEE